MKTTKEQRDEWRELAEFPANKSSSDSGVRYSIGALLDLLNDVDALIAERSALTERVAKLEHALMRIASYDEGPDVTSRFDEPCAARIARDALVPTPEAAR